MPTKLCEPNTPEWLTLRQRGLTASDSAAICGLSKWKSPLDVYLEKTGQSPPIEVNDAMRLGHLLEPVVKAEFTTRTGIQLDPSFKGLFVSDDYDWLLATPDGGTIDRELLEAKSTAGQRARSLGLFESDELPPECTDWHFQTQHQVAVMGVDTCWLAVLIDGREFRLYHLRRNDRLVKGIVAACDELWERIQNFDPPEPNWEHPGIIETIKAANPEIVDGSRVELSETAAAMWERYKDLGEQIKELDSERDKARARVLHEIGENYAGVLPDYSQMIRRKVIEKKPYTVTPKPYVDVREIRFDGGGILTVTNAWRDVDHVLRANGYKIRDISDSGSRYYVSLGKSVIRVADHAPNNKTAAWIASEAVVDIRVDRDDARECALAAVNETQTEKIA